MRATEDDIADILALVGIAPHRGMFILSNLLHHGLEADGPYGTTCYLVRDAEGVLTDVVGYTNEGMVMPFCPNGPRPDFLRGKQVKGVMGPADEARPMIAALGLSGATSVDRDEPHFTLDLDGMVTPAGTTRAIQLAAAPGCVATWFPAYLEEALGLDPQEAKIEGHRTYDRNCAAPDSLVLMEGSVPVAMATLNARVPHIVQVGGVYTPPEHRGKGHARRLTALLLEKARAQGVGRATLFAANNTAAHAYAAIGFRNVGAFTLYVLREPVDV